MKIIDKLIEKRYFVFLVLFIFCLMFKLHGSSIGVYDKFINNKIDKGQKSEIIGINRAIRSDEWMVHTPYYFSQYYNSFKKTSHQMSMGGQNMIIGYNAPVVDITMIGKPFTFGYILFGNEYGLSWYWCLKLFLLILLSFEFMMILSKNNKMLSLFGAFIISFSPPLQWWFVPHVTDVFIWALAVIIVTYKFFTFSSKKEKIISTLLAPITYIAYALAIFPSCQVPLGFISLALIVAFLIRDRDKIKFEKRDLPLIFFIFFITFGVLGYFIFTSFDGLKLLMHTVYPGSRISTGGDMFYKDLFTDLTTVFLPYKTIPYSNNCEASTFIHFGPVMLLIFNDICHKADNKKDLLIGKILLVMLILEIFFMLIGFPSFLAKLTMFSYINRMKLIYGFTALLLTIWSIYMIYKNKVEFSLKKIILVISLFALSYLFTIDKDQLSFFPIYIYIIEIIYFVLMLYLFLVKKRFAPFIMFSILIVFSSLPINPIAHGTYGITNHKTTKIIQKSIKDDGYWLATDSPIYANYVLACGGKVINGTNFYPDYKKWDLIDKKRKNDYYYNRYANITVELTLDKTKFDLIASDHLLVKLNYKDLKKLGVKYIFTNKNLDNDFSEMNIRSKILYDDKQIKIYKVNYDF